MRWCKSVFKHDRIPSIDRGVGGDETRGADLAGGGCYVVVSGVRLAAVPMAADRLDVPSDHRSDLIVEPLLLLGSWFRGGAGGEGDWGGDGGADEEAEADEEEKLH